MIKLSKIFIIACVYSFIVIASVAYAEEEVNADQRFLYIGAEGGIVEPVVSKFRHKNSNTAITLKRSGMYSAKIGYIFYPQIAIEFSATYQPKYRLHYVLPQQDLSNGLSIPKTPGKIRVISNIYMVNLIYDFQEVKSFTPFVIFGAGIAQVKVKSTSSRWDLMNIEYFKVRKTRTNCFAWQAGLGVSKYITPNFSIDLAAKLQVAQNVKINYDTLNIQSRQFVPANPIKKTIGIGEFGIGFTYRLPI
ncbi:outer membrane beta-barrel protein [Rickettsia endosymbiont of Aspidapion aeneum]|uniref:outer membrane protein n=1 Tax=Rickettsia endosymbiont of Aspidapion aeneum TaxID=3066247 RepID=UPI00313E6676